MDFTVWQDYAMGPGGKRSMNLILLSSSNSQNRNLQYFSAKTLNSNRVTNGWSCREGSGLLLLTADVEKIAELASAADGLYGMTRLCYGSGWFSPSSSQNRNFAIVAKKPKWNRVTNCRWTLRYDKIMLWVRVVRGAWIWSSYHPVTLKIGTCSIFLQKPLIAIELPTVDPAERDPVCYC